MSDQVIAAAVFDRDRAVQAFPLGGRSFALPVGDAAFAMLQGAGLARAEASVFLVHVPEGAVVRVGSTAHVGADPAAAKASMFPLVAGYWTFAVREDAMDQVVFLNDGPGSVTLAVLEAAVTGDGA